MANPTLTGNTYAGSFAGKYISAALFSATTLDRGLITIMPNVKYKSVLQVGSYNDEVVKASTCDFTASGALTLTEKVITPEEFQVNVQLCKKDLHAQWEAEQMGFSAFDNLAPNFEEFVIAYTAAKVANNIESQIWEGATADADQFTGFSDLLDADADVNDVAGASSAIGASATVIAELGKLVDDIPTSVFGKEDLHIYVAPNIARAYVRALGGYGAAGLGANGINGQGTMWYSTANASALSFDGIPVVVAQGLGANKAIAAQKSNLFFGTGLLSDTTEVQVIDMAPLDGSRNVRVIMRFTAAVQTGVGSDIVWYRP
tara:strand:- start:4952 stop:5902 length:951 start_codon:yes stop_codon:yes gene_type:complete